MDTSETYIKMCDCEEIQGKWHQRISEGDFTNKGVVSELETYYADNLWDLVVDNCVHKSIELLWLPRQDQLQEMVEGLGGLLLNDFEYFLSEFFEGFDGVQTCCEIPKWGTHCKTWEQLWLAFVMKEHNKVWDGEWRDND